MLFKESDLTFLALHTDCFTVQPKPAEMLTDTTQKTEIRTRPTPRIVSLPRDSVFIEISRECNVSRSFKEVSNQHFITKRIFFSVVSGILKTGRYLSLGIWFDTERGIMVLERL